MRDIVKNSRSHGTKTIGTGTGDGVSTGMGDGCSQGTGDI